VTRRSGSPPPRHTPRRGPSPAGAGTLLIATILACAGVGLAVGLLVGAPALVALAGGFVGIGVGFWVVYDRFKDL
jgi:hypothetical protein